LAHVSDCHKVWLDKRDVICQLDGNLKTGDSFDSSDEKKKMDYLELRLGGHIPIFMAKSFVEGA
jgi:FKBP-type peptidyl-prolyl cis-trans isomerase